MYIVTINTTTDVMMSSAIRRSSRNGGSGVIKATTIASTAIGTANSPKFGIRKPDIPLGVRRGIAWEGAAIACCKKAELCLLQFAAHQPVDVGEHFGNSLIEIRRNALAYLADLV